MEAILNFVPYILDFQKLMVQSNNSSEQIRQFNNVSLNVKLAKLYYALDENSINI